MPFQNTDEKEVLKRPKWADTGKMKMRPEGAFQRTQEQEVILDRGLNAFVICVYLRVICGLCARLGARGARKRS
jgi:hypothetical protein